MTIPDSRGWRPRQGPTWRTLKDEAPNEFPQAAAIAEAKRNHPSNRTVHVEGHGEGIGVTLDDVIRCPRPCTCEGDPPDRTVEDRLYQIVKHVDRLTIELSRISDALRECMYDSE